MYPEIEPYEHGWLEVGDGQRVYWETCGNPDGKPAVVLHGGPGSGAAPSWRRYFDPEAYQIVLVDQRGCERSTPDAAEPEVDLSTNTTWHLVRDFEQLREYLGIERWLLLGGSWGATLALAYAEKHPEVVSEIVLFSVTNTTAREVEWVTRDVGRVFPEQWARFRDGVPTRRHPSAVEAGHEVPGSGVRVAVRAAGDALLGACGLDRGWGAAEGRGQLAGIPGFLVHGVMDISGPADIAWSWLKSGRMPSCG